MAEVTDTALKGYFEDGDVPTQAQFTDLIDSKPNRLDLSSTAAGSGADLVGMPGAASGYTLGDWQGEIVPAPSIGLSPDNTPAENDAAIAAWVTAQTGVVGHKIVFGSGIYQFSTGFTLPDGTHLEGKTHWIGTQGGSEHSVLEFTGTTGTFITAASLNLTNIVIRGYVESGDAYSAGTVGLSTSGNVYAYNTTVSGFATGWTRTGGYYLKCVNGEFRLCNVCFEGSDIYNTAFIGTKFNEFDKGVTFSGGLGKLSFIGCSVEKVTTSFVSATAGATANVNFIAGYVENYPGTAVWSGLSGTHYKDASIFIVGTSSINIRDSLLAIQGVDRLVNGTAIGSLHAVGNTITWSGSYSTPGTDIPDVIFFNTGAAPANVDVRNRFLVDPSAAGVTVASVGITTAPGLYMDEDGYVRLNNRASRQISITTGAKVGATAGWSVNDATDRGGLAKCPASQTAATLVVPLTGLPVGAVITGYYVHGQIESAGGNVTLDAELRSITIATADLTDAAVASGAMTQVTATADKALISTNAAVTGLSVTIASRTTYYLLLTATTAASTDIDLASIDVFLTGL